MEIILFSFQFWHLHQTHTFINNLNDEEMITSHLMCYIIKQLLYIKIKISWTCYTAKPFRHSQIEKLRMLKEKDKRIQELFSSLRYYWFLRQKILFSAESGSYCWQSNRFSFRTPLKIQYELNVRSSYWSCSLKKGVLKNFANFTGKDLYWSLFLIESSGLQLYQEVPPIQVFSCGICQVFKNTYFEENLWTTASETCLNFTRNALFW